MIWSLTEIQVKLPEICWLFLGADLFTKRTIYEYVNNEDPKVMLTSERVSEDCFNLVAQSIETKEILVLENQKDDMENGLPRYRRCAILNEIPFLLRHTLMLPSRGMRRLTPRISEQFKCRFLYHLISFMRSDNAFWQVLILKSLSNFESERNLSSHSLSTWRIIVTIFSRIGALP